MNRSFFVFWSLLLVLPLSSNALGQTSFFNSVRPQASIVIKKHSMGADLVEMTVLGSQYPEASLREKIENLGLIVGSEARGIAIAPTDTFVKASFAVNGLINQAEPRLNLVALAKAFGFGPNRLQSFSVFFENVAPARDIPAFWFPPEEEWMMEGIATAQPRGIEYRVKVNTKDPEKVSLPTSREAQTVKATAPQKKPADFMLFGALIVGAIAVGLLVYSALIRTRQRA
jgi:hypothetical protein